jgi:hypothetical protein
MNDVLYYECKYCGTQIPSDTKGVFIGCKCGKIAVDGNSMIARIRGSMNDYVAVGELPKEKFVYRIKQIRTGLFFLGRGQFGTVGRYYGRVPSLKWLKSWHGECVIEKYKVERVIN